MTGHAPESAGIDPRLVQHFALFREPGPGPDGPLDEDEHEVVALRSVIWANLPRRPRDRVASKGLIFEEVRKVALDSERVMMVIPGRAGVMVLVRTAHRHQTGGTGAGIEGCLDGRPLLSMDQTLVGLAPDSVDQQPVQFRDGSVGFAPVRHNAYLIDDPSWTPD